MASTYRLTSKPEDDLWCLASLLQWDVTLISGVPHKERMRTLLSQQLMLPQGLLFFPGLKNPDPGWRWAPQTFGNNGTRHVRVGGFDATPGKRDDKGLEVIYPGIFVRLIKLLLEEREVILEVPASGNQNGSLFSISKDEHGHQKERALSNQKHYLDYTLGNANRQDDQISSWGIILQMRDNEIVNGMPLPAVMVEIDKDNQEDYMTAEVINCEYKWLAVLRVLGPGEMTALTEPSDTVSNPARGKFTNGPRKWIVG